MMNKKKIIFYYPDMYVGGVEMAILNLAKRIYKDYDLYFFYKSISDLNLAKQYNQYGVMRNIADLKLDMECDVLIYCSLWLEKEDPCQYIRARQRFLWTHAVIPQAGNKFYHLPTMRKIDRIIVVSDAVNESIPRRLYCGKFDDRIYTINNILNTEEIKEKAQLETPHLELAKDLNICTVARISHEKGWLRIKLLCEELQKLNIDFKWFIIGEGYIPEDVHRIHLMLDKIPQIEFLGKQLNPFSYVKQMDYSALLSDYESWGLVITEAKILGVPVIVSDFPAAYEQIEDDFNGVIVPRKDYSDYNKIAKRIVENKKLYKNGIKDFDYEKVNEISLQNWKKLLDSERNGKIVSII